MAITSISSTRKNGTYIIDKNNLEDAVGNLATLDIKTDGTDDNSSANVGFVQDTYDNIRSKVAVSAVCDLSIYQFNSLTSNTPFIFDDIELPINSRILCINDSTYINNGIWEIIDTNGVFSLIRPDDYQTAEHVQGADIFCAYGTKYQRTLWVSTTDETLTSTVIGNFNIYVSFLVSSDQAYVKSADIVEAQYTHKEVLYPEDSTRYILQIPSTAKIKRIVITPKDTLSICDYKLTSDILGDLISADLIDLSLNSDLIYDINTDACGSITFSAITSEIFTYGTVTIAIDYTL